VSIVHGDGRSGVMPDDVPLLNVMFHPNSLDLFGQGFELPETRGDFRSSPKPGRSTAKQVKLLRIFCTTPLQSWPLVGMPWMNKTGYPEPQESRYMHTPFTAKTIQPCMAAAGVNRLQS
jgi:hypothetical protein